jgi:hypothetical protein
MPPPEPLDESERALARALRNLPVGAPPPELDARILGAARRAVHLSPPRKRNNQRWIVGIGTAASALLAIGLFMKSHGPGQDAMYTPPTESTAPVSAADNAPAAAAAPSAAKKEQAEPQAAADMVAPTGNAESAQSGMPAETPAPQQEAARARQPVETYQGIAAKPAPQAFPNPVARETVAPPPPPPPPRVQYAPAPPAPVVLEESAPMAASAPPASPPPPKPAADERQEHKAEQDVAGRRDAAAYAMPAPASQVMGGAARDQPALSKTTSNALKSNASVSGEIMSDSANATEASKDKSLDRVDVDDGRFKQAKEDKGTVLPPIDDDARLSQARWIERIRARVDAADGDGARESLRRFHARYPGTIIPTDLRPLLH